MPKATDLAYVMYQATDLDLMEKFMNDFGLITTRKDADKLFLRGVDSAPFIHVTHKGAENRFLGAGFHLGLRQDLESLAAMPDSGAIEPIADYPGGGLRVRMTAPDGFLIDAVWGQEQIEPIAHRPPNPYNWGETKSRVNGSLRPRREPGQVLRLGHFVLRVSDHDKTLAWFQKRFGLLSSDMMKAPVEEDITIGTFVRFDKGDTPVDHHCMLINQASSIGVHHCAFEMQDIDSVMGAHDHLISKGYALDVGVGRHLIGSQIFDYWRDPFGNRVEHYTDGDVTNVDYKGEIYKVAAEDTTQWGMDPMPTFFH